MKFLHTADWHLGRKLEGRYRHDEQTQVMDEICRIAHDEDVDAILIAGDVYDSFNPPAESESLFYETITRLSAGGMRAIVMIAGNHDSPDRLTAAEPYGRALGVITVGYPKDIPEPFDCGTGRVACVDTAESFARVRLRNGTTVALLALPYPSEARLQEVLSSDIDDENITLNYNRRIRLFLEEGARHFRKDEPAIVMSHLFLQGGLESESERPIQVGGAYSVDPHSFPLSAGYVALGHLHRAQNFKGPDNLIVRYAGSPLQYSFSEAGQEKSVTIVEFEGEEATHRIVPLKAGRPLIHRDGLEGVEALNHFLEEADPDAWISFSVMLNNALPPGYLEELGKRHRGILKHIFHYHTTESTKEDAVPVSMLTLEEQFKRYTRERGEEPSSDVLELFLKLAIEEHSP